MPVPPARPPAPIFSNVLLSNFLSDGFPKKCLEVLFTTLWECILFFVKFPLSSVEKFSLFAGQFALMVFAEIFTPQK